MTTLLEFKEKLKIFYTRFDIYLVPFFRFVAAFAAFLMINANIGFMPLLNSKLICLLLALICCFFPLSAAALFGAFLILGHAYALSLEAAAISAVLMLIMFLLYFRIAPHHGFLLILTPIAFVLKIPYVIPIAVGLTLSPVAAVPVGCGTIGYYLMHYLKANQKMLGGSEGESIQQKIVSILDNILKNKEMYLLIGAFAVTILVVYVIRRLSVNYAWQIAIGAGALVELVSVLAGGMILDASVKLLPLLLGLVAAVAVAFVLQFFLFSVDYSRTEYVQFEDDEYYYYVKAVPKVTISVPDKQVKKISTHKKAPAKPAKPVRSTGLKKNAAPAAAKKPVRKPVTREK